MSTTRIAERLPPKLDVTKASVAYGDRALPKLHRELQGDDLLVTQQALRSLCDMLRNPEHIQASISEGIFKACQPLLAHDDLVTRQLSLELISYAANHAVGRSALLDEQYVAALTDRFRDSDAVVRRQTHRVLGQLTVLPRGAAAVLEAGLAPTLVERLVKEDDRDTKVEILTTIHHCLKCDTEPFLATDAMTVVVGLLGTTHSALREAAALVLTGLSFPLEGKRQGVAAGAVAAAVQLHADANPRVRSQCAAAIMSLAITTEGKAAAMEAGVTEVLPRLLQDSASSVVLAAVKAITTVAEHPAARQRFAGLVDMLKELKDKHSTGLNPDAFPRAVDKAIATIQWTP